MMDINFELYKVFYYVAKDLSFSSASHNLFISQSAVSQSIKTLEEKLDCKLFFRSTKQVKLTPEGALLFQHIEQAFNFIKTGERALQEVHSLKKGEIRIGASDTICKHYLLPYFKAFNELYPSIKIQVTNRTSPRCMELLHKGSLDLIVVNIPQNLDLKNFQIRKVKDIQDVIIAGEAFQHLTTEALSLDALATYPILMLEKQSTTRRFLDDYFKEKNVSITPEIELGSVDLLVELTKIGLGLSFVVKEYIEDSLATGEVFILKLQEEIPTRQVGVLTHSNLPLSLAAEKFIELLE